MVSYRVERWALRLGAFALPLWISFNTFDQFIFPKLVLIRFLLVLFAGLYLGRLLFQPRLTWKRTAVDLPLLAFVASAALSTIFAINVTTALFGTYSRYEGLLTIASYAGLFWLTVQLLQDERDATGLVRAMLASAYVVSILAVVQSVSGTSGGVAAGVCLTRPYTTFGQPLPLAAFLAMLLPAGFNEAIRARAAAARVIALNVSAVMGIALLLTLTRGAWIGAALGLAIVFIGTRPPRRLLAVVALVVVLTVGVGLVLARTSSINGVALNACQARVASLTEPSQGSAGLRLHLWSDSLRLIASRPLVGYGPDTFALAYPKFQSGDWDPGHVFDKAHSDILQIASTQGLVGVAIDLWLLVAFIRAYVTGDQRGLATGLLGGWAAYQTAMQLGFSWIPSAGPFWMFAAAAITTWKPDRRTIAIPFPATRWRALVPAAAILVFGALALTGPVATYFADVQFFDALKAGGRGDHQRALAAVRLARQLAPDQWVYAVQEGNVDLGLDAAGVPRSDADWSGARSAYEDAARLGTFNPAAFRNLAIVDLRLGFRREAEIAARRAVELDRFDPSNMALLRFVTAAPP